MNTNKSFSTETSERYSRALFEVANEANELDKIEKNIASFQAFLKLNTEIDSFLKNPTENTNSQNVVIKIISEKLNYSKNLQNFFLLLIEKRRIFFVKKINESFLKLCSKKRGEIKASLVSSKKLSETELEEISKDLSKSIGSVIKFDYKVDENLIGGLKLQLGSYMIDSSIKNKLKKYKQAMIEN
tara:strand:- start:9434 stop:9991 length:558 start_codon:yes stop_codon:yes gene_type:complete